MLKLIYSYKTFHASVSYHAMVNNKIQNNAFHVIIDSTKDALHTYRGIFVVRFVSPTYLLVIFTIDNIAYETGLESDDFTSLTCVQIWADRVCYAGDEAPAKKGRLNGQVTVCSFVW